MITTQTPLPLADGLFTIAYHSSAAGDCVSVSYGDLQQLPIVRLHSSCLFGESFMAQDCECAWQLRSTLWLIRQHESGVVVYSYAEGRGIGLENKIKALALQQQKSCNTVEAFAQLGFAADERNYQAEIAALADLQVASEIQMATQNPNKLAALRGAGYTISKEIHPAVKITQYNLPELQTKRDVLGYHISPDL